MNTIKKFLPVLLGIAAVIFAAVAILFWVQRKAEDRHTEEQLAQMQAQAESIKASEGQTEENAAAESGSQASSEESAKTPSSSTVAAPSGEDVVSPSGETSPSKTPVPLVENPYRDSFLANEDMAAWLKIENTKIDCPVMWTPRDETYYLYRGFDGKENQNGCLLLDTDSCLNPLTTNLIIHGHNMRSGAMFGRLTDYEKESYCKEHNIISLYTEDRERRYEVIAVFRSQVYLKTDQVFKFYKFFQADTQEEFDDFYKNIKALSLYDTGVTAEFGDHFITLSTCVYHVEQGRFVVVAKEIETGDWYSPFRAQANTN